jgi:hypothetical protein
VLAVDFALSTTAAVGGQPFLQSINNLTAHLRPPQPPAFYRGHHPNRQQAQVP